MSQINATGGTVRDFQIGAKFYRYHFFKNVGAHTFTVTNGSGDADVLVVGGGGSGGISLAAGGGAGGLIETTLNLTAQSYAITVGAGGAGQATRNPTGPGQTGENSNFGSLVALGGGGGGGGGVASSGLSGGSGGGSCGGSSGATIAGAAGLQPTSASGGFGNDGGDGRPRSSTNSRGGGGGGAGQAGQRSGPGEGNGGNGLPVSIITPAVAQDQNVGEVVSSQVYFAGGGGAYTTLNGGKGGLGGGGNGTQGARSTGGTPNTGGGGGAHTDSDQFANFGSNPGGSGVVVIRYEVSGFLPIVSTETATEITKTSARLSGEVTEDGGLTTTRGIAVATGPTFNQTFTAIFAEGLGVGAYDIEFGGLNAATTYHFRAFATSAAGTAFGDWVTFTTDAGSPPTAVTGFASNVSYRSARLSGTITDAGEGAVTARGIAVGPRPAPVPGQPDVLNLPAGDGLGSFNAQATGLEPDTLYYFRAYGTNAEAGTGFGDDETFETLQADGPTGVGIAMPDADEDTDSVGLATFDTDPMDTGTYTWQVAPQTIAPYTGGTSATLTVDGITVGTVQITGQGRNAQLTFTPEPDWFGTASFSARVSNGFAFSEWASGTVTIRPVPDEPSAVVGEFPTLDEDTTAEFDLTWTDPDDLPPGSLAATDGYTVQMRRTTGGNWLWLQPDARQTIDLGGVIIRVLSYSDTELRATFRVEPKANYNGPYAAQVRVADQSDEGDALFGPPRTLFGTVTSVPDAPTRPQPARMPTAKVGQTVTGRFSTFDPDLEDTSWLFEISAPGADDWGNSLAVPGVGTLTVIDDDLTDQETQVRLDQTNATAPAQYVTYPFDSNNLNPQTQLGGQATAIVNGSLSALTTGDLGYLTAPVLIANPASGAVDADSAVATGSYFEFSATLPAGVRWTSLQFLAARGGAAVPRGYAVRTSADGYATTIQTHDIPTQRTEFTAFTVPLANLPTGQQVTFRIYVYAPATGNSVEFDDITIKGALDQLLQYQFDLRVTDSSSLTSPTQTVSGFITPPTAAVFLQRVTRNSPASLTPLTPLVEIVDLQVTDSLEGVGGADVTVATDELRRRAEQLGIRLTELIEPGNVELVVAIGGDLIFCGPLGDVEWDATSDTMSLAARSLLGYLEDRRIGSGTKQFVAQDISTIAWTLIDDSQNQSFGDLAFTDNTSAAGTSLTVEFESSTRILDALRTLSRADGGPEMWLTPDRRFNAELVRGQDKRNRIRLTPGMMRTATWTNRDEQIATVVTVIGGEDGMGGFFQGTATDAAGLVKYGRRERLIEARELTSDQDCEDYAQRTIDNQARRTENIRVEIFVTPDRPFSIRDLEVGDIVTADIRDAQLGQVIGDYRIVNRRLNLISETADSYRVKLDLVPAPFVNGRLAQVKARHNASIIERLAQLDTQQK